MSGVSQRLDGVQQRRDPAELGLGAGRDRHAAPAARGDDRAGVQQAAALGQRRVGRDGRDVLVDRLGLAGQRRLLRAQRGGVEQPDVGGHAVALRHLEQVAGHDVLGRDLDPGAVAAHARGLGDQLGQRGDRAPGAVLLGEPDQRVEDHDGEHDQRRPRSRRAPARAPPAASSAHISGVRTWSSSSRPADGPAASGSRFGP